MQVYLGLGSNLGDRRENLRQGIRRLACRPLEILRVSPVVESPALLPDRSPAEWNRPFLNLVLECEIRATPQTCRGWIKDIEHQLNGALETRYSPRAIDIDMLIWGREALRADGIRLPYPDLQERPFYITPLVHLQPNLTVPPLGSNSVFEWSQALRHHIPLWMGIVNVTPDSFSDGGKLTSWPVIEPHVDEIVASGGQIIDVGGESTRPGASPLTPEQEWDRVETVLALLVDKLQDDPLRPLISVDTRHPTVAHQALELGADIINDVAGLSDPEMLELTRSSGKDFVAMHSLSVPADRAVTLNPELDPGEEVERWLIEKIESWDKAGLDLARIIFDPGIGFGKDALQSLNLLRHIGRFRRHGLRVLVGHSRKSFMASFSESGPEHRDLLTIGASLNLCEQGVDIIRVHDVPRHLAVYRGWSHLLEGVL